MVGEEGQEGEEKGKEGDDRQENHRPLAFSNTGIKGHLGQVSILLFVVSQLVMALASLLW